MQRWHKVNDTPSHGCNLCPIYERGMYPWDPCRVDESCPLGVGMRSPLPSPCVPDRPSFPYPALQILCVAAASCRKVSFSPPPLVRCWRVPCPFYLLIWHLAFV